LVFDTVGDTLATVEMKAVALKFRTLYSSNHGQRWIQYRSWKDV